MLPSSQNTGKKEPLIDTLVRKCKEQPLVPAGVVLTVGALYLSGRALRMRDSHLANRMFFWRVGFQGFTVAALLGGSWYYSEANKIKPKTTYEKQRDLAKQREQLWLEELDRIDAEALKAKERAAQYNAQLKQAEEKLKKEVSTESSATLTKIKESAQQLVKDQPESKSQTAVDSTSAKPNGPN